MISGVKNAITSDKVNTTVNNVTNNVFDFIGKAKDKVTHEIKEAKTVLGDKGESRSERIKRLESERNKRVILGVVLLFIYLWPVSCWLFYRAYVINKEINDLKNKK